MTRQFIPKKTRPTAKPYSCRFRESEMRASSCVGVKALREGDAPRSRRTVMRLSLLAQRIAVWSMPRSLLVRFR